jgi:hypothetical protein
MPQPAQRYRQLVWSLGIGRENRPKECSAQFARAGTVTAVLDHHDGRGGEAVGNRVTCLDRRTVPPDRHVHLAKVEPGSCRGDLEHRFWQARRNVERLSPAHRLDQVRAESVRQREGRERQREHVSGDYPADHVRAWSCCWPCRSSTACARPVWRSRVSVLRRDRSGVRGDGRTHVRGNSRVSVRSYASGMITAASGTGCAEQSRWVRAAPKPRVSTGMQETSTTTGHGARVACAAANRW